MQPGADSEESLAEWRARLAQRDAALSKREHQALAQDDPDRVELRDLARMRDDSGTEWDELAARYDALATRRDLAALDRDVRASARDVRARDVADDADPGFPDRWLSATDRDDGGGDRADAGDDRRRSAEARDRAAAERAQARGDRNAAEDQADAQEQELAHLRRALSTQTEIGQAIGLLMARYDLSSDAAFALLCRRSQDSNVKVHDLAASILAEAQPGPA